MAKPAEVMKICAFMAASYPTFKLQKETIDAYAKLFAATDPDVLARAAEQAVLDSEFFPTPKRLRDEVAKLTAKANPFPDYAQAWENVQFVIRRYGHDEAERQGLHVFDHPMIEAAVRRVGWYDICYTDLDNINTLRAQFRDVYNTIVNRAVEDDRLLPASREMIKQLAARLDANRRAGRTLLEGGDPHD